MDDEDAAPVRRAMKSMLLDGHRAISAEMALEKFVVVARDIDDLRTFAGFAQDFLNHVVVFLRPIDSAA